MTNLQCRTSETLEVAQEEDEVSRQSEELDGEIVEKEAEENHVKGGKDEDFKQTEDESNKQSTVRSTKRPSALSAVKHLLKLSFGCLAAVACGMLYAAYLSMFHERRFWFSTRPELERELTFQGGSGVYYYYYKHMLAATSFDRAFYELATDDRTLAGQTINAVERLSLYPELITSYIYRVSGSQDVVEPIYFYVGSVLALQAVYATALFTCSWLMSGSLTAGVLAVAWYIVSRPDATKVEEAVPLRENWALPYYACQVAALTGFLCGNIGLVAEMLCYLTMSATTFTFLLLWEHSHYVLFVQAFCLFLLDSLDLVPPRKISDVHKVYVSSLLPAFFFHFNNAALLGSPLLSLLIGSGLAKYLQQKMKKGPLVARVIKLLLHFHLVFTTAITFNYLIKKVVPVGDGEFILKFLEVKFGLNITTDFVSNFLVCQESLQSPTQDLYLRLTQASVLPFYLLVLAVCVLSTLQAVYTKLSGESTQSSKRQPKDGKVGERPEVVYHVFHTLIFGGLTLIFDGMKYLWTPYVCAFAAFGVCSPDFWMTVFRWLRVKSIHPVVQSLILGVAVPTIIGFSVWQEYCPRALAELFELQGFYDPDTVEMIGWIRTQLPAAAVFAGSPQLLGAIKLGSGAAVTSLPLHSDVDMLRRSEDSYQVYSMRSAEEVYKILTSRKANYVIVEESLCNELTPDRGCRIKDLLDVANGHVVRDHGETYAFSKHRRFCQEIKTNRSPYTNYFTRVFWNRSYHIYRVNSVISFQY
ncbi:probable C-mannosyltransferase DPY19L4 isoform X2 [Corythoichthys intestinalis]|uniref:probable C-mannosyltransferase DPY19L4 isoform X2 n=1 Tax=Corythoichthys intestinalis TaxID=161448 RepID=UPI0025A67393|nr:probable C-mannosyltransferase DPY19L4 isoform X2 [Corythoichthys intestinalis]